MSDLKTSIGHRELDIICLGRAAVDLYGQQIGARLEDMGSFAKYLGGSSGNIAYGTARLGLRSAMLTRVGDEHMGRFITETLKGEGVDDAGLVVMLSDRFGDEDEVFFGHGSNLRKVSLWASSRPVS